MGIGRKPQNIRHFNNKVVARLLLENKLSCREIQKKIGLTHAAVRDITERLSEMRLIKVSNDIPEKRNRGGQHVRYTVNEKRAYFVCINFQHASDSVSICDLTGNVLWCEKLPDKRVDRKYFLEIIAKITNKLSELKIGVESVAVVSVSISGQIDQNSGKMIISFKIGDDFIIKDELSAVFSSAKIEIKNDTVYCCMSSILSEEFDYDKGASLFLYVGDGISNVFVYNKQIIGGPNGFSGEIGANDIGGGKHLYELLTPEYIIALGRKQLNNPSADLDNIIEQSEQNRVLHEKFVEIAENLGVIVRNLVDITGCSHVILSGVITKYPRFFYDVFTATVKNSVYSENIPYVIDFSKNDEAISGQIATSKLMALDWVMEQY